MKRVGQVYNNNKRNFAINTEQAKRADKFTKVLFKRYIAEIDKRDQQISPNSFDEFSAEEDQNTDSKIKYADYEIAPVGIDLISLEYQLSPNEIFHPNLAMNQSVLDGQVKLTKRFAHGPRLGIRFNATTLNNKARFMPLSLREYRENFKLVEQAIQRVAFPSFNIWRCAISTLEIFKTVQMTHAPLDYCDSLRNLGVMARYMKQESYYSEGTGTFSLKNGQEEVIFYDKEVELIKKLRKKKHAFRAMPERMMRVEWKFTKEKSHVGKLKIQQCIDLLLFYESIAAAYVKKFSEILPDVEIRSQDATLGSVAHFEEVFNPKEGKKSKSRMRRARDMLLARYIVENKHLENYNKAQKGSREQTKSQNKEMAKNVVALPNYGGVRYIEIYAELQRALLSNDPIRMPVSSQKNIQEISSNEGVVA